MTSDLQFYYKLLLRRLPVMLLLIIIATGSGIALAMKLPTTYVASARLLVESPQIPDAMVASTIATSPAEQLEIIRQRLTTRANLIDIAHELDALPGLEQMNPDDIVSQMRERTSISSRGAPLVMTISFRAGSGAVAAAVVNQYVTLILDESIRLRTSQAEGTMEFFEQEVNRLQGEIELQTQDILEFKSLNSNALPENQMFRLDQLSRLQERITRAERDQELLAEQRIKLIELFETTGRVVPDGDQQLSAEEQQLASLRDQLETALALYSETNPRVRIIQNQISTLEEVLAQRDQNAADTGNSQQAQFDEALAELDDEIADLEAQITSWVAEIADLEASVAATPANGIVLDSLERDMSNLQRQYDIAYSQLAQARISEQIELTAKGQRISIIEPASVPNRPASPNRPMVAGTGVGIGLMLAAGLFVLLELLNRTVRRPAEVTSRLGITPLAAVPFMESRWQRFYRRGFLAASLMIVILGVPAAVLAIDTYYMPVDLLVDRIIDSLGLA